MVKPATRELEIQIRKWIKHSTKENSRLEFKQRIELGNLGAKAEFIRDVIALANSEGEIPREAGYLVIGVKEGKLHDIQTYYYDGATFGQILASYIAPHLTTSYEEFDNGEGGRLGVLIVKPDPRAYLVCKKLQGPDKCALLAPGQCWARRSDRKEELSGEEILTRFDAMAEHAIERATAPLLDKILRLEHEAGPALDVRRVRFEIEAAHGWPELESMFEKLLPYAREFDHAVKEEVLEAVLSVSGRAWEGITEDVVSVVDSLLAEIMPMRAGGMQYPAPKEISVDDQALLKRVECATFELAWNACRRIRDIAIVKIVAMRYRSLIRFTTLNGLDRLQIPFLDNARRCRDICSEEQGGKSFAEGWKVMEEAITDALDIPVSAR